MGWFGFIAIVAGIGFIVFLVRDIRAAMRWPDPVPRPFFCVECGERYQTNDMLMMHVRAAHHEQFGPLKARLDVVAKERRAKQRRAKRGKLKLVP